MFRRTVLFSSMAIFVAPFLIQSNIKKTKLNSFNIEGTSSQPISAQNKVKTQSLQNFSVMGKLASTLLLFQFGKNVAFAESIPAEEASTSTDTYVTTSSGLKYFDSKVGEGASPLPGDTVRVHYTGWLDDFESEKKFDSSFDRRSPLVFKVGVRQVIAGWDEALLNGMKVGGKRDVIIPPELGYGKRGAGGVIPPNATLYFKMELVGIGAR